MLIPKIQFYRQKQVFSVDIVECDKQFVFSYINAITLQSVTTILVLISVPLSDLVVKCTSSLGCFLALSASQSLLPFSCLSLCIFASTFLPLSLSLLTPASRCLHHFTEAQIPHKGLDSSQPPSTALRMGN